MKYLKNKKLFESQKDLPENFLYCFDALCDLPGFYMDTESAGFDYSLKIRHTDGKFEYDLNLLDHLQEIIDRVNELNLEFNRSFINPSDKTYMSSVVCTKKRALEIDGLDYWLGTEFPAPEKMFFTKYPIYRKCHIDRQRIPTHQVESIMSSNFDERMSIKYPLSKEDILYTTSLESISFLFFEKRKKDFKSQ